MVGWLGRQGAWNGRVAGMVGDWHGGWLVWWGGQVAGTAAYSGWNGGVTGMFRWLTWCGDWDGWVVGMVWWLTRLGGWRGGKARLAEWLGRVAGMTGYGWDNDWYGGMAGILMLLTEEFQCLCVSYHSHHIRLPIPYTVPFIITGSIKSVPTNSSHADRSKRTRKLRKPSEELQSEAQVKIIQG